MPLHCHDPDQHDDRLEIRVQFAAPRGETTGVARLRLPDGEMAPDAASQVVRDSDEHPAFHH